MSGTNDRITAWGTLIMGQLMHMNGSHQWATIMVVIASILFIKITFFTKE